MGLSTGARKKFCESSIVNKEGRKFTLDGRPWVEREFWEPANSWRIIANDKQNLCDTCSDRVWELTQWSHDWRERYACDSCAGCKIVPILVVILNLPRREGKTFNVAAYTLSEICLKKNRSVLFLATSGDQSKMLYEDNWETPVKSSPVLSKMLSVVGERITCASTGSQFRYAKTSSANAIAGGGISLLVLDECRGLQAKAAMSAIGSTRDQGGLECPKGHVNIANTPGAPERCPACDAWLEPWYPMIVLTSSSGIETGTDLDWFQNLVDAQTGSAEGIPVANVHTFRMTESQNPVVRDEITNAYTDLFMQSPALRPFVGVEMHNQTMRVGEDFVPPSSLQAITNRALGAFETCEEPCVAFLDTSTTGDLTSLVIVADDPSRSAEVFNCVRVVRVDTWDPKKMRNGVIDAAEIEEHVARMLTAFPAVQTLAVDVRGTVSWAPLMVANLRRAGHKQVIEFGNRGSRDRPERDLGWSLLEQRIMSRRIQIPEDARLIRELKGVHKRMRPDGSYEVKDRNRSQCHADISEGIASACLLIHRNAHKPTRASVRSARRAARTTNKYIAALSEKDLL